MTLESKLAMLRHLESEKQKIAEEQKELAVKLVKEHCKLPKDEHGAFDLYLWVSDIPELWASLSLHSAEQTTKRIIKILKNER